jgi:hypothetical protein
MAPIEMPAMIPPLNGGDFVEEDVVLVWKLMKEEEEEEEVELLMVVEAQCVNVLFLYATWFLLINSLVNSLGEFVSNSTGRSFKDVLTNTYMQNSSAHVQKARRRNSPITRVPEQLVQTIINFNITVAYSRLNVSRKAMKCRQFMLHIPALYADIWLTFGEQKPPSF